MIEYVYPANPDDRVIARAADLLRTGGLVAYPTDSSWAVGCSSDSASGLEKLGKLREDRRGRFSLICSDISQMSQYTNIATADFKVIKSHTPGPYVFILPAVNKIERKIGSKRNEVGARIPDHQVPLRLVQALGHPLFSITASRTMADVYEAEPEYLEENLFVEGWELEAIDGVDLIIDTGESLEKRLSTILRLGDGEPELVRLGRGTWEE